MCLKYDISNRTEPTDVKNPNQTMTLWSAFLAFEARRQFCVVITSKQSDVTRLLGRRVYGDRHCCLFSKKLVPLNGHSSRRLIKEFPLNKLNMLFGRPPPCAPAPCKLTFDILTFKVVSESYVTRATSVPILVFLSLSVLDLATMYATDRRQTDRRQTCIIA